MLPQFGKLELQTPAMPVCRGWERKHAWLSDTNAAEAQGFWQAVIYRGYKEERREENKRAEWQILERTRVWCSIALPVLRRQGRG